MSVARAGGNLLGMAVISLYCLVVLPTNNDPEDMKVECRQNMFLNAKWRKHIGTLQKATAVLNIINAEKAAPEPEVEAAASADPKVIDRIWITQLKRYLGSEL